MVLAPVITWAAPASRGDVLFLEPSVRYCGRFLEWVPDIVVGDMAYISLATQRRLRAQWHVAMVTKFRPDMNLPEEFEDSATMTCEQGQVLRWLGLNEREQLHWFGVVDPDPLCACCWQGSACPRHFSFRPQTHEILYGTIPVSSAVAQQLLRQARSWIEAAQSYEKNQLGLNQMFLNSLHLTWTACLLADTVTLLRARVLLLHPPAAALLEPLLPAQMPLDLF